MAEVLDSDQEMSSESMPGTEAREPTEVEHDIADVAAPAPGSLPLITEHGNPRIPRVLLDAH